MVSPRIPFPLFLFLVMILHSHRSSSAEDSTTVVYKGCSDHPLSDAYSQSLSTLFGTLVSQSSKTLFSQTTSGTAHTQMSGLYQCRGDLSSVDCYNCVSKLPILIDRLCGRPTAARMHLSGCYMAYEVAGSSAQAMSGMEMVYKSCSGRSIGGEGFEEKRDTALAALENGMSSGSSKNGFLETNYGSVYVVGQCEGDLGGPDCGQCVQIGVQRAQVECGSASAAQVCLNKCFVSYGYYPDGVPKKSSSASAAASASASASYTSGSSTSSSSSPSSTGLESSNSGRTVAIIVGGAAGVGFLVICLLVARNLSKKNNDY